jgi:hypothetical protein
LDNLWIEEDYFEVDNDGKRWGLGNSEPYESMFTDVGKMYRSLVKEFGRCTGKVRIDPDGKQVGWVFVKRKNYEDEPKKTYLQEVWITVHNGPPKRTVEYDLHAF